MRMTNNRARKIVDEWLKATRGQTIEAGLDYRDYTNTLYCLLGISEDPFDIFLDRAEACEWLRDVAHAILDGSIEEQLMGLPLPMLT